MELSENKNRNVYEGQSQRRLDEDEYVYETIGTQMSRTNGNREPQGADTTKVKSYREAVVCVVLLCVLLLIVIIRMVTTHTAETDQLQRSMDLCSNLTRERDTNLTKEREHLQSTNNNLIKERDLFQERNTKLTKENYELRDINRYLTAEKNDLMDKNRNLTAEKEKLLNTFPIPQDWIRFGYSFYYISNDQKTWSDGKQQCMDRGGYLIIIDSEEEQVFISGFERRGWIGLTRVDGKWKWLDGELLKTGYWMAGEPNNARNNEHCVEMINQTNPQKSWNDVRCSENRPYFCERPLLSQ